VNPESKGSGEYDYERAPLLYGASKEQERVIEFLLAQLDVNPMSHVGFEDPSGDETVIQKGS
jgi:hypothetical protein